MEINVILNQRPDVPARIDDDEIQNVLVRPPLATDYLILTFITSPAPILLFN